MLHICAERGYEKLAELLCQAAPRLVFEADIEGNTPMHVVCDWDYVTIVKTFCDAVDAQLDKEGQSSGLKSGSSYRSTEDDESEEEEQRLVGNSDEV